MWCLYKNSRRLNSSRWSSLADDTFVEVSVWFEQSKWCFYIPPSSLWTEVPDFPSSSVWIALLIWRCCLLFVPSTHKMGRFSLGLFHISGIQYPDNVCNRQYVAMADNLDDPILIAQHGFLWDREDLKKLQARMFSTIHYERSKVLQEMTRSAIICYIRPSFKASPSNITPTSFHW